MKAQSVFIYLLILLLGLAPQCFAAQSSKDITELNPEELEIANEICRKAMKDFFGDHAMAWYKTTYHYLPTTDDDIRLDFAKMKKLARPITVFSVTGVAFDFRFEEMKNKLKERVAKLEVSSAGKRYRIVKSLVVLEPGGGGGSMHMSFDKITLIPYLVEIY
jgi:hypothetical protein